MISHARLLQLLRYCPETGLFYWRVAKGTKKAGAQAGSFDQGYLKIRIDQFNYRAGRLAYFYMTKRWVKLVDHKDTNRANNKWSNLRPASHGQNTANSKVHCDTKIKLKGVTQRRNYKRYRARIVVSGKEIHLGMFANPQDAHAAYITAAKKHFGEFARAR